MYNRNGQGYLNPGQFVQRDPNQPYRQIVNRPHPNVHYQQNQPPGPHGYLEQYPYTPAYYHPDNARITPTNTPRRIIPAAMPSPRGASVVNQAVRPEAQPNQTPIIGQKPTVQTNQIKSKEKSPNSNPASAVTLVAQPLEVKKATPDVVEKYQSILDYFTKYPKETVLYSNSNSTSYNQICAVKIENDIYALIPNSDKSSLESKIRLYKAENIKTLESVACKMVPIILLQNDPMRVKLHFSEVNGLKLMGRYKGELMSHDYNFTIQTWVGDVNLHHFILNPCPDVQRIDYILQMIAQLKMIHQKGYLITDVKPSNFVLDLKTQKVTIVDLENMHPLDAQGMGAYFRDSPLSTEGFFDETLTYPGARFSIRSDLYSLTKSIQALCSCMGRYLPFYGSISNHINNILMRTCQDYNKEIERVSSILETQKLLVGQPGYQPLHNAPVRQVTPRGPVVQPGGYLISPRIILTPRG